jgi:hypothetical protein
MSYRNDKRRAAIWLLQELCKPSRVRVTALIDSNGRRQEITDRHYNWVKLTELIPNSKYSRELLRDAVDLLVVNGHVDLLENYKNAYEIEIRAFRKGEISLRDDVYQEEISNYNSDKTFRNLRWILPLAMLILTAINIGYSFYKQGETTSKLKNDEQKIYNIERQLDSIQQINARENSKASSKVQ